MKMTVQAKDSMIDNLVNKIYNLLFGYLDSLFDDSMYEKKEETIPKSQAEPPKEYIDVNGNEINPEDFVQESEDGQPSEDAGVEVSGDGKAIHFLPIQVEGKEVPDEFTIEMVPVSFYGNPMIKIKVTNNTTGKTSMERLANEGDDSEMKEAVDKCKKEVSATCKIKLTKITGSSGTSVRLTNIHSNYDLPIAVQDISCILDDDSFVDSLPEGDSAYLIDSGEDGYDVNTLDWDDSRSLYTKALDACFKALGRIYELGWYSQGIDSVNFKNIVETLTYSIQYNINELAKLCIIHGVPTSFEVKDSDVAAVSDKWISLCECVSGYIAALECLSMSATGDEKNMIDGWIRNLNDIEYYQIPCLYPEIV